ncbi:MAG: helix-turn-helix domain-containing protein [Mucilaginibacter polytrichastri]|nr:helix-turn-helix domain-containing protein [Mucilaginibacter polytrichastri]
MTDETLAYDFHPSHLFSEMEKFSFNELPEVVRQLFEKIERIETLLESAILNKDQTAKNELMNVEEAAEFLKISVAALYTKVSRYEIPYSKPGKRLYFERDELIKWIQQSKRKTLKDMTHDVEASHHRTRLRTALRR